MAGSAKGNAALPPSSDISVFKVSNWHAMGKQVNLSQPVQLAFYSRQSSAKGGVIDYMDAKGLMPIQDVSLPQDLSAGYPEAYIRKDGSFPVSIEPVIQAMKQAKQPFKANVCTFRSNLNKIAMTLLNPSDAWIIDGCQSRDGLLCLDIHALPQKEFQDSDRLSYYGYKLESLCTCSDEVDATSEFCSVVKMRLGDHRIIMGAEVDACHSGDSAASEPELKSYVEIKSYKIPANRHQDASIKRYKHPRWWVQCFLLGVEHLLLGGRDNQGMLRRMDRVMVKDLSRLSRQAGCDWDPNLYLAFLQDVLAWMQYCGGKNPGKHLQFKYRPEIMSISCSSQGSNDFASSLRKWLPEKFC